MAVHGAKELVDLGILHVVAFGPHDAHHHLKHGEGAPPSSWRARAREAAQDRRGEPRVGVSIREEPAIEDENAAYVRPAQRLAPLERVGRRRKCSKTTSEEKSKATSVVDWIEISRQIASRKSVGSAVE